MSQHNIVLGKGGKPMYQVNEPIVENDKVSRTSAGGGAVQGDSTVSMITADADDRRGWLFKKTVADIVSKFNYYFYGSTTSSHPWKLKDLKSLHATCSIDSWAGLSSAPFMVAYTKPTGSGDASWYKSRIAYSLTSDTKILAGEHVNLYWGTQPHLNNNSRYIHLDGLTVEGTADPDEEIFFLTLHSDSAAPLNTQILVSDLGFSLNGEIKRNIKLV